MIYQMNQAAAPWCPLQYLSHQTTKSMKSMNPSYPNNLRSYQQMGENPVKKKTSQKSLSIEGEFGMEEYVIHRTPDMYR